jgi:hypothetical protein
MAISLSGSLEITGSIYATGGITGSFSGTATSASYAANATSASYALIATSASYAANSDLLDGRDSLTFANTGSNSFVGTQNINGAVVITGSLTTTGAITAQTLNVQQVTSSIVYSSGSNIFGNSVSNTQSMTGSVGISGSLAVVGAGTFSGNVSLGGASATNPLSIRTADGESYIRFLNADGTTYGDFERSITGAGAIRFTGANFRFTAGVEVVGALTGSSATFTGTLIQQNITDGTNLIGLNTSNSVRQFNLFSTTTYSSFGTVTNNPILILTNDTERMRISSAGNVGIGTTSALQTLTLAGTQMMYNTGGDGVTNVVLGSITSQVRNYGTGIATSSFASIQFATDPTTWYKGDIRFLTNGSDGTSTSGTERMRITSDGNVQIGNDSNPLLEISNSGSTDVLSGIRWVVGGSRINYGGIYSATSSENNNYISFYTKNSASAPSERMRINSAGDVIVKGSVANISLLGDGVQMHFSRNATNYIIANGGAGSTIRIISNTNGVELSNGATSWIAVSDENVKVMTEWKTFINPLEKIISLRAGTSRYKTDSEDISRSFLIAQDVQKVLPEAVSVDDDGILGLRYTEVIPLMIAAIQEQQSQIEALKLLIK